MGEWVGYGFVIPPLVTFPFIRCAQSPKSRAPQPSQQMPVSAMSAQYTLSELTLNKFKVNPRKMSVLRIALSSFENARMLVSDIQITP